MHFFLYIYFLGLCSRLLQMCDVCEVGVINLHDNLVLAAVLQLFVGQDDAVPDVGLVLDGDFLAQDRDRLDLQSVLGHGIDVVCTGRGALHAGPAANLGIPANNRVQDAGILLNVDIVQNNRITDTSTFANDNVGSNGHVRSELQNSERKLD